MSHGKFAAVTASLLARKGEATPWNESWLKPRASVGIAQRPEPEPFSSPVPQPMQRPAHTAHAALSLPLALDKSAGPKMHKYALHMTEGDYEKLGLIAVKQGTTRQQLMQQMLADFFAAQARDYRGQCACLGACDTGCEAG